MSDLKRKWMRAGRAALGMAFAFLLVSLSVQAEPVSLSLEDGEYAVELSMTGGSGKASISSPAMMIVKEGRAYARAVWSSSNYDYMIVDGEKILNENTEGGYSTFTIPILAFDQEMEVTADTTAMGTPHEIAYAVTFYGDSIAPKSQLPQEAAKKVLGTAAVIIFLGGILNHFVNKRRNQDFQGN